MRFKLWGTRGSLPSPIRTEEIEAKLEIALAAAGETGVDLGNPAAIRAFISSLPRAIRGTAGGDTTCLEVRSADNLIIFDCGSGMRRLGLELMKQEFGRGKGVAHIFITHTHWDHMMGWPFFVPGYVPGNEIFIYSVHQDLEERFRLQQTKPSMFPVSWDDQGSTRHFVPLEEGGSIQIGQTLVRNERFYHLGDSFGYRVEDPDGTFIYGGDSEFKTLDQAATQHAVEFFRDADVLVFDAMFSWHDAYRFEDWGHSSAVAGVDLAIRAGVRKVFLFHHAPASTDEEIWGLRDYADDYLTRHPDRPQCQVLVAFDGFEMELWREAKLETRTERLPDGVVVHLDGRLIAETTSEATTAIAEVMAQTRAQALVLDLEQVAQLDQDGIKALFSARRRWRPLALAGLSPELERTFARAGALEHFAIFDTPDDALAAIKQGLALDLDQLLNKRYRIEEKLDRGPLGDFYRATDQVTRRQATVLVFCPSLGHLTTEAWMAAARTTTELRHPLITDIFDVGHDGPINYAAMEYTPGRSIRQILAQPNSSQAGTTSPGSADANQKPTQIPPNLAVYIGLQIAQVLEFAHGRNIVHGALSPENIIVLDDNSIKVNVFGIGRPEIDKPLIEMPAFMGPSGYLAPEQLQGHGSQLSSDLYALGAILYEMLTGQPPSSASDSDHDMIDLRLHQDPIPLRRRRPNLSYSLEHIVLKLLSKSPQERYASASNLRHALTSLVPQLGQSPFLGQDATCQKLRHHMERVAQGQSGLIVFSGPRGIGKSRLALSVAASGAAEPAPAVLYGELFAFEALRCYGVFVASLQPTLSKLPAHQLSQLLSDLGDLSDSLTALIPEIQPTIPVFTPSDNDVGRAEEAICESLRLLVDKGPVVLILDSLQWVDAASLRLLDRLARQRIAQLLIVVIYRSEETDQNHPLCHSLSALKSWIDEELELPALTPINVHQLASALSTQIPPDFGLWLYGETEGNPLHTQQLIQAYSEGPSETHMPHGSTTTRTLDDVILRRLERLPSDTLDTLRQAAVLGNTFYLDHLCTALDHPEQQVLANLDVALQACLIHGHPVKDRFNFSHPLIREALYLEMLGTVRKRYHLRAASFLERGGIAGKLDAKINMLAHHYLNGGEADKAMAYLARATRRARDLGAYDVALIHVNQALTVVEQLIQTAANNHERQQRHKQQSDLLAAQAKLEELVASQ